jgi:SAM-dependent methyltransferase
MTRPEHPELVAAQFGATAAAYVASGVHARGADLDLIGTRVRERRFARALDLGCGGGHVAFTVAPHVAEIVAYDLSPAMLAAVAAGAAERGLTNVANVAGGVERLPFADASFELVVSRFSAHHWSDVRAGLAEARRVLVPGGTAIFIDVVAPEVPQFDTFLQAIEVLRDPTHVRDYAPAEWRAFAAAAGLAIERATPGRLLLEFASWTARANVPPETVVAIRALQARMPQAVADAFALAADGSFTVDTLVLETLAG